MELGESSTDAASAVYFICILLQPFSFDLTFCPGSCGQIYVRSRPKALLKIDERNIRQTKFMGSSAHTAYDTVSDWGDVCAPSTMCVLCVCICVHVQVSFLDTQGLSVGHVLFLTIHPHPSEKEREEETGPVQIHYSNHLKKRGQEERKWDTTTSRGHSLCDTPTVQYDYCLTFLMLHNPTFLNSVCQHWLF